MLNIRHIVGAVLLLTKGLVELIDGCKDFYELEKGVHELTQKVCNQLFTWLLEVIDDRLKDQRDRKVWEVGGFKNKTALCTFGEFLFKRRLYRNKKTGETKFLLDEYLGWPSRKKITPRLKELLVTLSAGLPFRRAAEALSYLIPRISAMTVWQAVQETGEVLQQEAREKRAAVFERGELPGGKEATEELYIEADGVNIRLQRSAAKKGEIKHAVAYEGKEEVGRERLDPYHLRKRLTEALYHSETAFTAVCSAIARGSWEETSRALLEAAKNASGTRRKEIIQFLKYLQENWEGIAASPKTKRLGAIEGQVQHNLARRMKRLGATRWTILGGDRMARILSTVQNGQLTSCTSRWPIPLPPKKSRAHRPVPKPTTRRHRKMASC